MGIVVTYHLTDIYSTTVTKYRFSFRLNCLRGRKVEVTYRFLWKGGLFRLRMGLEGTSYIV